MQRKAKAFLNSAEKERHLAVTITTSWQGNLDKVDSFKKDTYDFHPDNEFFRWPQLLR